MQGSRSIENWSCSIGASVGTSWTVSGRKDGERRSSPQSDLAQQLLKDPSTFDFLMLSGDAQERELELGLVDHIQ
ncbi:hypothetical protein BH24CHL4_BH24CHL4_17810 [soil metagenome]